MSALVILNMVMISAGKRSYLDWGVNGGVHRVLGLEAQLCPFLVYGAQALRSRCRAEQMGHPGGSPHAAVVARMAPVAHTEPDSTKALRFLQERLPSYICPLFYTSCFASAFSLRYNSENSNHFSSEQLGGTSYIHGVARASPLLEFQSIFITSKENPVSIKPSVPRSPLPLGPRNHLSLFCFYSFSYSGEIT